MPAKRYFEFSEGSSNKFWEVWCDGASLYTRYGKIGSTGQLTVKDLASKDAAKQAHDKLVREKTGKGYVEQGKGTNAKSNDKTNGAATPADVIPEGAIRLVTGDGKAAKFWQIHVDGKKLVIKSGKAGTPGTVEKKTIKDAWMIDFERNKAIAEMRRKGYELAYSGPQPKTPPTPASDPRLEAQIAKDPHNDDNFAVYADWLQEQGDVRGELASLQIQAAKQPKDKKLRNAANKLLTEYRLYFYGPLAVYVGAKDDVEPVVDATWRAGWIDELALGAANAWGSSPIPVANVADLVRVLPDVSSARLVRSIVLTRPVADGEFNFASGIEALVRVMPKLPALRRLELGRFSYEDSELSWSHMGPLGRLWPQGKQLETVKIRAGSMDLGKIVLPECREFRVETGGLAKKDAKAIAGAQWPRLETLSVWFGMEDYGCTASVKDLAPIFDGKGLGKLRHLGLKNSQFGDEIFAALAKSKILRQLETLDVSMSHITTDVLTRDVLPHKAAFAHLASLDLSRCRLDAEGTKLAKTLCKNVDVSGQDKPEDWEDDDYRYAAVGE